MPFSPRCCTMVRPESWRGAGAAARLERIAGGGVDQCGRTGGLHRRKCRPGLVGRDGEWSLCQGLALHGRAKDGVVGSEFGWIGGLARPARPDRPGRMFLPGRSVRCSTRVRRGAVLEKASSRCGRDVLGTFLALHGDHFAEHGVGGGDDLGVGLEAALGGDHAHELRGHVHVGQFQGVAVHGALAAGAGLAGQGRS